MQILGRISILKKQNSCVLCTFKEEKCYFMSTCQERRINNRNKYIKVVPGTETGQREHVQGTSRVQGERE